MTPLLGEGCTTGALADEERRPPDHPACWGVAGLELVPPRRKAAIDGASLSGVPSTGEPPGALVDGDWGSSTTIALDLSEG